MQRPCFKFKLIAMLLCAALAPVAQAQDPGRATRELATSQAADRHARLLEAAKKESDLSVYHVYPNLPVVMAAFTQKYGIKVKAWRAGSEAVLQRLITEQRAGRFEVDVVQNNSPENEAAHREGLLQEVWSAHLKDLVPAAAPAHKAWAGITLDVWTAAYNSNVVKKEDLPKSYQDLADPRWKGRLGIEANNHIWFGALLAELGEDQGTRLFNNIVTTNGISARKGHSALAQFVANGEVPLALTVYSWNVPQLKKKGAPIEGLALQPVIAQTSSIAMLKRSSNPASALLFYEFMIGEGQKLLAEADFLPANRQIAHPFSNTAIKFIDPGRSLDMQDKWLKNFDDMIIKKAR